jgi:PAS domain S-box-containing protein
MPFDRVPQVNNALLQDSEALLRAMIKNLPGGAAFVVCQELRYWLAEGEALAVAGWKPEDLLGRTIFEVLPPDLVARGEVMYRQGLAGEPFELEHSVADRFYITRGTPLRSAEGEVYAVLAVSYDITDRKRQEQHQAFLSAISQELVGLDSIAETMDRLGEKIGGYFEVTQCVFTELSADFETAICAHGWNAAGIPSVKGTYRMRDFLTDEQIAANNGGQASIVNDTQTDPRVSAERYGALNIRSFVIVPQVRDGLWQFMISMIDAQPRQWREDEIDLLQEITNRIWTRLERARAEERMRESELQRIREQSAREEERQRAENLAELDRAKTLFFSNISHEFRTPLTLLLAPLQDALSDRTLAPVHQERLELAYRNANRLLKLVNTLLDFSRLEAGRMEALYEPTDLSMYTTELASVFRSAIERVGLQLIVDCPPLNEPVYVDREMWEKIVLNLLSNAFKFTLEGNITVRLHAADRQVILEVQDTGTGIAPEHLPRLFERFYQVRGIAARTHEGSGIGLALVDELVRLHGGTLKVSSTPSEGTCFSIALPFGTSHLPSERLRRGKAERLQEQLPQPSLTLVPTLLSVAPEVEDRDHCLAKSSLDWEEFKIQPKFKVLLVDDNADMREYLTRILSDRVQVEAVANGTAALAAIQAQVPDLVLSDVMMPGLDGFQLLHALRSDPKTRELPIILLSARAGEETIVEGLEAGADDYLIKPFSAQELIARVTAHLQMAQLRQETLQQERIINSQKDEFISTVSHELNTPLVSILGWTRLLRTSSSNPALLSKALDTIERNATLQAKLVQDLLDLTRITAGKLRLHFQPLDLSSIIATAIASVIHTAVTKKIHLTSQINVSATVMGDCDRIQQVVTNLLTNAIKFTRESGHITVHLSILNCDLPQAEIRITDTGIGIAADFLPYIFDRFRQADNAHSTKGLGLGLAIARHIVELHHGTIEAASNGLGEGATFTVHLPLTSGTARS